MKRQNLVWLIVGQLVVGCVADSTTPSSGSGEPPAGDKADNVGDGEDVPSLYERVTSGEEVVFAGRIGEGSIHESQPVPEADGCELRFEPQEDHVLALIRVPLSDEFGRTMATDLRIHQPTDGSLPQLDFTADDFQFYGWIIPWGEAGGTAEAHYHGHFDAQDGSLTMIADVFHAHSREDAEAGTFFASFQHKLVLKLSADRSGVTELEYVAMWDDADPDTVIRCQFGS